MKKNEMKKEKKKKIWFMVYFDPIVWISLKKNIGNNFENFIFNK
jgi:hypothetical protein